jgi:hypothetical protein
MQGENLIVNVHVVPFQNSHRQSINPNDQQVNQRSRAIFKSFLINKPTKHTLILTHPSSLLRIFNL